MRQRYIRDRESCSHTRARGEGARRQSLSGSLRHLHFISPSSTYIYIYTLSPSIASTPRLLHRIPLSRININATSSSRAFLFLSGSLLSSLSRRASSSISISGSSRSRALLLSPRVPGTLNTDATLANASPLSRAFYLVLLPGAATLFSLQLFSLCKECDL